MDSGGESVDPALLDLAGDLRRRAASGDGRGTAYVVAVVGGVAVGKSVLADRLAAAIRDDGLRVEVVGGDSFLLPNEALASVGGATRKGFPESFDWRALDVFLRSLRRGGPVSVPVYSHEDYDIVPGRRRTFDVPDVVVVEGLNLLQPAPPGHGPDPAVHLDRSVYIDAEHAVIEEWFVERFVSLARPVDREPSDFYRMFAAMSAAELEASARWVWAEVNEPNLRLHVEPTRDRADVVLHKGADHRVERVSVRR